MAEWEPLHEVTAWRFVQAVSHPQAAFSSEDAEMFEELTRLRWVDHCPGFRTVT